MTSDNAKPLIIVGASARAAAQSASRAGYGPWCIDLFADRDLQQVATVKRIAIDQYPQGLLKIVETAPLPSDTPVLYTGALENHPDLLEAIAFNHPLLGCSADSVKHVRDPQALGTLPEQRGLRFCKTPSRRSWATMFLRSWPKRYLLKRRQSAGGLHVQHWRAGKRIGRDHYLQQFISGKPISAAFVGDGWSAGLMGVTEQLIGDEAFGVTGFRYCGNIGPMALTSRQKEAITHLGVILTQRFDVRGPFGVDAVIDRRGDVWPVEVNPRYTAGMEILERAMGISAMGNTASPKIAVTAAMPRGHVIGKAIVFAKANLVLPDLYEWFKAEQIADVPAPRAQIYVGWPTCTLFATAPDRDACLEILRQQASKLYAQLAT